MIQTSVTVSQNALALTSPTLLGSRLSWALVGEAWVFAVFHRFHQLFRYYLWREPPLGAVHRWLQSLHCGLRGYLCSRHPLVPHLARANCCLRPSAQDSAWPIFFTSQPCSSPLRVISPCLSLASGHTYASAQLTPRASWIPGGTQMVTWRMDTSQNTSCSFCPPHSLDPLRHHALTCKSGCDLVIRHNSLRDTFFESCKLKMEDVLTLQTS